ncbi:MAG: formylglycine-generating enzyme family protein [Thermoanaerobaculia bacterium]|nr:formylglycine-generating enzyme family protein [Thermoanaerobaculia bacterium]
MTTLTRLDPIPINQFPGIPTYRLLHVPGGEFRMGSDDNDKDAEDREKPAHRVTVDDFYLGEFPVTQDLWVAVMGENPSRFKGPRRPVENVSWNRIVDDFLPALRKKTGQDYRLPTEAEWEYAARGGPFWQNEPYRFAGSDLLAQVGWYNENSGGETHDVGLLLPNALDLYDMSGNVWEWCADNWHDNYRGAPADGKAWPGGNEELAVLRGGSWILNDLNCRVARRYGDVRNVRFNGSGFRLARGG